MDKDKIKETIISMINRVEDEKDIQMLYGFVKACVEYEKCTESVTSCQT
jgi:hypothetical protein